MAEEVRTSWFMCMPRGGRRLCLMSCLSLFMGPTVGRRHPIFLESRRQNNQHMGQMSTDEDHIKGKQIMSVTYIFFYHVNQWKGQKQIVIQQKLT